MRRFPQVSSIHVLENLSGGQYEGFMNTFSRSSSHAVDLSRAIASNLRLGKLDDERADRVDGDTTRIVDLGSGPGVALGLILREEGIVREVSARSANSVSAACPPALPAPPDARPGASGALRPVNAPTDVVGKAAAAPLSVWCTDPFYCNSPPELGEPPIGGGVGVFPQEEAMTLPTDVGRCRLQVVGGGRVHFVSAEAVDFLQSCRERVGLLDRVLMKEMVHHVGDYAALGRGLREALRPGTGMALIAGRTPSDTIPWFPQAKRQFAESCMDTERICRVLRSVPGLRVTTSEHVFNVHFKLADWCTLLRGRFWSHLDTIGDDDMERGVSQVRVVYGEDDAASVTFPDNFTFVQVFRDHDARAEMPRSS